MHDNAYEVIAEAIHHQPAVARVGCMGERHDGPVEQGTGGAYQTGGNLPQQ